MRVAINGFGRIGSCMLRASENYDDVDVVAINDIDDYESRASRAAHDTLYGSRDVALDGDTLEYGDASIKLLQEEDPAELPWDELDIDVALEASGHYRTREGAANHLDAGAEKSIISAPPKGEDHVPQYVYGVNHEDYDGEDIVSNASCTTNCVSPVLQVLEDEVGIMTAMFDTVHAVTGTQTLVDQYAGKPERQWAGWQNIIPSSTGASSAIDEVLPDTGPKVEGTATRVPDLNASMTEFYVLPKDDVSRKELDAIFEDAAEGAYSAVMGYVDDDEVPTATVSSMMNGRPESVVYDATNHEVTEAGMHRITGWYDNETGFATRMLDLALHVHEHAE